MTRYATAFICAFLIVLVFSIACVAEFDRDPVRTPAGDGLLSPADGIITRMSDGEIQIYIGLHDVHIQRAPLSGVVTGVTKCRVDNKDHVRIAFATDAGGVNVTQISGNVARTILTYVDVGDEVERGDKIGRILLGSGTIVTIPDGYKSTVHVGKYVKAGETVLAVEVV